MSRKIEFTKGEFFHVFNRGTDKRKTFTNKADYLRFLTILAAFNTRESLGGLKYSKSAEAIAEAKPRQSAKLVDIICYNILPNHFHLLIKQIEDKGISQFMQKVTTGYTMYFNKRYNRSGSLFQGPFKANHVNSDNYMMRLICYISGNSEIHKISKAEQYEWSSLKAMLNGQNDNLCDVRLLNSYFNDNDEFKNVLRHVISESTDFKDAAKIFAEA